MASGSWEFGTSNKYINGQVQWTASSNGSSANSSSLTFYMYLRRTNTGYHSWGVVSSGLQADSNSIYWQSTRVDIYNSWVLVGSVSYTIPHNSDGSKSCYLRATGSADFGLSYDSSNSVSFDQIPRYASIGTWSVASKADKSIAFQWGTNATVSKVECFFNGALKYSGSVNSSSGTFSVSGLTENTNYGNITLRVTRKDSGLTTDSGAISTTTAYTTPTITKYNCVGSSINSLDIQWSCNYACDAIWIYNNGSQIYSLGGLNSTGETITLTPENAGIVPGTAYSLVAKVRRKESQSTVESSIMSISTQATPSIASSTKNSFNIEDNIIANILNSSNIKSTLIFQYYTSTGSWTNMTTVDVGIGISSTTINPDENILYSNCKASNTIATRIACVVTNNNKTYTSYYNVTGNVVNSNPVFAGFSFETNRDTPINAVIGGTTNMIYGFGNLCIDFSKDSAAPKNQASISSFYIQVKFGVAVIHAENIPYNSDAFVYNCPVNNFVNIGTYSILIFATDSRGNISPITTKTLQMYQYFRPRITASVSRYNEFEQQILINISGIISKINIGSPKNAVSILKYRCAETGTAYPNEFTTITGYILDSSDADNISLSLIKDSPSSSFISLNYEKSYNFEFVLVDKLYQSETFTAFVAQGKPAISMFDDGYMTINRIPDFTKSEKLQVSTDILAKNEDNVDTPILKSMGVLSKLKTTVKTNIVNAINTIWDKLGTAASYNVANNTSTTVANMVLDARMGKLLDDKITTTNKNLSDRTGIFEEGSNSNGNYIKWNNGILEQWFHGTVSAGITSPYGMLYQNTFVMTYPIVFLGAPIDINCHKAQYDTGASWSTIFSYSNGSVSIRAFDIVSRPVAKVMEVSYYVRGFWK